MDSEIHDDNRDKKQRHYSGHWPPSYPVFLNCKFKSTLLSRNLSLNKFNEQESNLPLNKLAVGWQVGAIDQVNPTQWQVNTTDHHVLLYTVFLTFTRCL